MDLRDYERQKFAIAEILRSASLVAPPDALQWQERLRDLFVRLAEDRFNLVVVGRFNRGKTSIMNAIMGTDRLPVGIIPLTSVITTVSYGTTECVVLKYNERILTQEVSIETLHQYVTQEGNPGNARGIKMAEVQLRSEILRRGFYFVDTPGLGSAIPENTRTPEAFLPEADAFLVVTSFESPLSQEEMSFFRDASSSARRIFVVINKHDTVTRDERATACAYVRGQLRDIFGEDAPQLFSVSARDALEAKRFDEYSRLATSGIPELEEALVSFLLAEKKNQFLAHMSARVAELISDLPASAKADRLVEQVDALVERFARRDRSAAVEATLPQQQVDSPSLQQLQPCEICAHIKDALWEFECKYQYELSTSPGAQNHFAENGGLCSFHTWQYHAVASPYGICTAYPILLDHLAAWLRGNSKIWRQHASHEELQPPLPTPERCVSCNVRATAETKAIADVVKRFSEHGANALNSLSAICIPHLTMLADALKNPDLVRKLFDQEAALIERLSEDMKRFTLKRDAARRVLETKEEITAAERALSLIAGHRNVIASTASIAIDRFKSAMAAVFG
jgi:GTP-binding protein EngB required for normal cell division